MFSPPDETIPRSERKMKVVHVQNDKNKAIILRLIVFQPSKFSTNFVLEAEQFVKKIYFRETQNYQIKATKSKKHDRKFNNNVFSFKMRQKTYLKAQKCSKFHRGNLLHDRVFELIFDTKAKA